MFGRKKREEVEPKARTAASTTKTPADLSNEPTRSTPVPPTHPLAAQRAEKRVSVVQKAQGQGQVQGDGTAPYSTLR